MPFFHFRFSSCVPYLPNSNSACAKRFISALCPLVWYYSNASEKMPSFDDVVQNETIQNFRLIRSFVFAQRFYSSHTIYILSIVHFFVCRCHKLVQHNKNVATNWGKNRFERRFLYFVAIMFYTISDSTHIVMERTFQTIAAMWMIRNQFDCREKHHFSFVLFICVACWFFSISEYINDKEKSHADRGGEGDVFETDKSTRREREIMERWTERKRGCEGYRKR